MLALVLMMNQSTTPGACSNDGTAGYIPDGFSPTTLQCELPLLRLVTTRISTSIRTAAPLLAALPTILDLSILIARTSVAHYSVAVISFPVHTAHLTLPDACARVFLEVLLHPIQHCV